jgi:FkbM family methyltransferase
MTNNIKTVPIQLLKDKIVFSRLSEKVTNIVLIDLGCAVGDFLDQLTMFDSITAIGVDPLLDIYSYSTKLKLYTKLIKACVTNDNDNNTISFNYYPSMPDVSSVHKLTSKLTNNTKDKGSFYHYMPHVVQKLSNAEFIKITVPTITLNTILNTVLNTHKHVDILKIDIQGMDLEVLTNVNLSHVRMIHIEGPNYDHSIPLYDTNINPSYEDYVKFFTERNFELEGLYKLDNDPNNYTSDIDYIFVNINYSH